MTSPAAATLHRTPFHSFHLAHGGRMVDFAGWEMPMLYRSIIEEHRHVRSSGGVFDVSHMGRVRFEGPDAGRFLDRLCTRAIQSMEEGQVRYSLVCNERGGCRDDVLVYRLGLTEFLMVCNAANRQKLLGQFEDARGRLRAQMEDQTFETGMLALQGPAVIDLVGRLAPHVRDLKRYRFTTIRLMGASILVSRTGYTGEDGVEVILPAALAAGAVALLVQNVDAEDATIRPAGLGARDTLRLEAAMPLYGHEIGEERDPLSTGLDFAVKLDKGLDDGAERFIGQEALRRVAERGPAQKLAGLRLEGRRTARQGMAVTAAGARTGEVTSACLSPTLEAPIAMAYLDAPHARPGGRVEVDLGRAAVPAEVVPLPFYKRR